MMINPVGSNINILDNKIESFSGKINNEQDLSFRELLEDGLLRVNDLQNEADKVTTDFALGKIDNIHQVTIATEKAQTALNLTIAIQNKVVEAYKSIMRIQI